MTKLRTCWRLNFVPLQSRRVGSSGKLDGWKTTSAIFLLCAMTAIPSSSQTVTILFSFDGTNGENPGGSLVQGFDGYFYGTAQGGVNMDQDGGTIFKISSGGTFTTVYNFCLQPNCPDGSLVFAGLVQAIDGNLYGTTVRGGANDKGTVFKVTPQGTLTTLYSFCAKTNCADGSFPFAGLVQATDGNLYGTTSEDGRGKDCTGAIPCGTVFKITPGGTLTTLYSFCNQPSCTDGGEPLAALIQATDGSLYGTTNQGGIGNGTVFKITRSGTLTTVHTFESFDGSNPDAGLVQATDGNFYGTNNRGGARRNYGTVYKMARGGNVKAVSFDGADGALPSAGLVQATDGNLYGTTDAGGSGSDCNSTDGCGTIFKIGLTSALTTLYSFCVQANCPDGFSPAAALVQGTDGNLYGMTDGGGASPVGFGTIFSLSTGLGPFVKTLPTSGRIGAPIVILGTNLTGATGVSFNGATAAFTVVSSSEITTTVPTGATSGTVQVTAPSGMLLSNVAFLVKP